MEEEKKKQKEGWMALTLVWAAILLLATAYFYFPRENLSQELSKVVTNL